jgi:phosphoribosylformylglycinamidine synthase
VVGGNVSLYNETEDGPIYPTPVVGMVGELPDPERAAALGLGEGAAIAVCGPFSPSLAGSELAKLRGELGPGLPSMPIDRVKVAIDAVRSAVRDGTVGAAHDVSDGGLACALAELAIGAGTGLEVDLDPLIELRGCSGESALFGEGPGGFVLAGERAALEALGAAGDLELVIVGSAGGGRIAIAAGEAELELELSEAERAWNSLGERMDRVEIGAEIAVAP